MNARRLLGTLTMSCCLLAFLLGCSEKGANVPTTPEIDKNPMQKINLMKGLSDKK